MAVMMEEASTSEMSIFYWIPQCNIAEDCPEDHSVTNNVVLVLTLIMKTADV
jgi:hypothetical protein